MDFSADYISVHIFLIRFTSIWFCTSSAMCLTKSVYCDKYSISFIIMVSPKLWRSKFYYQNDRARRLWLPTLTCADPAFQTALGKRSKHFEKAHFLVLSQFFHHLLNEYFGCFVGSFGIMASPKWNLMEDHCNSAKGLLHYDNGSLLSLPIFFSLTCITETALLAPSVS